MEDTNITGVIYDSSEAHCFDLSVDREILSHVVYGMPIIGIADLGRWNGRFSAYKRFETGEVSECLYSDEDFVRWYVDSAGDFRADTSNHDADTHILYRAYRYDADQEEFEDIILRGAPTREQIEFFTVPVGDDIARIYGWKS